jgi:hypothetical protein
VCDEESAGEADSGILLWSLQTDVCVGIFVRLIVMHFWYKWLYCFLMLCDLFVMESLRSCRVRGMGILMLVLIL